MSGGINWPKVSVIVVTYVEANKRYLDLCVRSIKNLNYPKDKLDVIVVSKPGYVPAYEGVRTVYPDVKEWFFTPVSINYGVSQADKDSEHFLILNDDTILTKNSLANMVSAIGPSATIMNPISPCDAHAYRLLFGFSKDNHLHLADGTFYRYENFEPYFDELMNADSFYREGVVAQNFLCMYATLFPRFVWEKVGGFDEMFKTGQDDIDYSLRARLNGVSLCFNLHAVIWHFGGVNSSNTITDDLRKHNVDYFIKKWNVFPPGIDEKYLAKHNMKLEDYPSVVPPAMSKLFMNF